MLAGAFALFLIAAAPEDDSGRGSAGSIPESVVSERTSPRWRVGLGAAGLFAYADYAPALGLGVAVEGGVVLGDHLSLMVHGEVGTIVLTVVGGGGLLAEYAFSDHFSAGLGLSFSAWAPVLSGGGFYGLTFPLRVSWAPGGRKEHELSRSGLLISLQVAPGFSLQPNVFYQLSQPLPPEAGVTATVSVGYALW